MTREQILERLLNINILYKESDGSFYCDIKKACGYPDVLNALADFIGGKLQEQETCIAVSGYGGLPLGAIIASRFNRKLITVRKTEKKYGPRGLLDGYAPTENDITVIIDDVLATGESIQPVIDSLKDAKIKVSRAIFVAEIEKVDLAIQHESLFLMNELIK